MSAEALGGWELRQVGGGGAPAGEGHWRGPNRRWACGTYGPVATGVDLGPHSLRGTCPGCRRVVTDVQAEAQRLGLRLQPVYRFPKARGGVQ